MSELINWDVPASGNQTKEKIIESAEVRMRDKMVQWVIECPKSALLFQYKKIFGEDKLYKEVENNG